jgi:hypothetical protein
VAQKAATITHKPEPTHTNGVVYQPPAAKVRRLLFNPADETNVAYRDLHVECRMKIPMSAYFQAAAPVETSDPDYWHKVENRHRDFAARALVSWNVVYPSDHEQAGEPIPATADGFMELDIDMAIAIRNAWFYTLGVPEEVTDPLASESPSSSGEA